MSKNNYDFTYTRYETFSDVNNKINYINPPKKLSYLGFIKNTSIGTSTMIIKRKIAKKSDFPISRLQKFEPAHGKPSVNKTMKAFHEFRELIFDSKGEYRTNRDYAAKPGSACKFCEFYDTEHCKWGKIL